MKKSDRTARAYFGMAIAGMVAMAFSLGCVSQQAKAPASPPPPISLGAWVRMEPDAGGCLCLHSGVAINHTIYLLGGGGGPYVWYARVGADGKPGPWRVTKIPDDIAYNYSKAVAYGNRIYLLGGHAKDAANHGTVAYVDLKPDGTPGEWRKTTPLPNHLHNGSAAAIGTNLYYVGGGYGRRAYYAPINADGTVGAWKETKNLISPRGAFELFAVNGWLYAVAGNGMPGTTMDTVYRAQIQPDGSIVKWIPDHATPAPVAGYGGVLVGDVMVIAGGGTALVTSSNVWAARVGKDGSVGPWASLPPLPRAINSFASVYVDGWLYVTGGFNTQTNGTRGYAGEVYGAPVLRSIGVSP